MQRPLSFTRATRLVRTTFTSTVTTTRTGGPQAAMSVLFAPVLLVQARRTHRRTPRLDPASGADRGTAEGAAPLLRLLVIGESTAAGVGAAEHERALPGFLAGALQQRFGRGVAWNVAGKNGATARRVHADLVPGLDGAAPDIVVVTVGINDLIRRRPLKTWTADLSRLLGALRARYRHAEVIVAGMPPVHRFPVLPQPLRLVMGGRARAMDRIMREVARAHGGVHVPMDPAMAADRGLFASDGLHPSTAGYRVWAHDLAGAVPHPHPHPSPHPHPIPVLEPVPNGHVPSGGAMIGDVLEAEGRA